MARITKQFDSSPKPVADGDRSRPVDAGSRLAPADAASLAGFGTSLAIQEVCWLPLQGSGMSVEACFLSADVRHFDPGMFAAASMVCPDVVARSVPQRQAHFFSGRMAARMAAKRSGLALADGGPISFPDYN